MEEIKSLSTLFKQEPPKPTEGFKNLFPILESDPMRRPTNLRLRNQKHSSK